MLTYNNVSLPSFMYGTAWKKDATSNLVQLAVESGFKAIDTANQLIHYNEIGVGEALNKLQDKGIEREQLFLQTKFTPSDGQGGKQPYDAKADLTSQVQQSFESSLSHLHTDYLDSYVLHGPYSRSGLGPQDWEVWAAIEDVYRQGKARTIGISNVNAQQLEQLCRGAQYKPMMVQNRCFAAMAWDKEVREICLAEGIIYQGFSLLTANGTVLSHPFVQSTAKKLGVSCAQIIFAFAIKVGMLPLTGTSNETHMKHDLDSEKLVLSTQEVKEIEYLVA